MNVLFLTLADINSIKDGGIYSDLLREFVNNGHNISIVSPIEKLGREESFVIYGNGWDILKLKIGKMQKNNLIKKGINTILLEKKLVSGIKKYYFNKKFDLVIYSTPPITFAKVVKYVKNTYNAKTYLLLKDIFPQNAVDLGILKKKGFLGIVYKYFRKKEKQLYLISDYIGCMSEANIDYLLEHNPYINKSKVHISPNCIEVKESYVNGYEKIALKMKYNVPSNKVILVYGGNLGKPQGMDYIERCIFKLKDNPNVFFLIIGEGTEKRNLNIFIKKYKLDNVLVVDWVEKNEYDKLLSICDIGLIFLDYRFTIPNFPSRILSYMQAKLPIIASTDQNTDVGSIIEKGNFGYACYSDNTINFVETLDKLLKRDYKNMGYNGYEYLKKYYAAEKVYKDIIDIIDEK